MDWLQQFLSNMNTMGGGGGYQPYGGQPPMPAGDVSMPGPTPGPDALGSSLMPGQSPLFGTVQNLQNPFPPPNVPAIEPGANMTPASPVGMGIPPAGSDMTPASPVSVGAPPVGSDMTPASPVGVSGPVMPPMPPPMNQPPVETIGGAPSETFGSPLPQTPGVGGEPGMGGDVSGLGAALSPRSATPGGDIGSKMAAALRGVQAPTRDVVKPSTPSLPNPQKIQAGQLFDMLQMLSNPRQAMFSPQKAQTLGGALGTGRY